MSNSFNNSEAPSTVSTTEPKREEPKEDVSAMAACRHFRNVARDVNDGILTDTELREKLKEVNQSASAADDAKVRDGAKSLLAAFTTGTTEDVSTTTANMVTACEPHVN